MLTATEFAGFARAWLAGAAYIPQISHLVRARCSAGISRLAFEAWLLASLLTTPRVHRARRDPDRGHRAHRVLCDPVQGHALPGPSASPAHGQDSRLLSVHARIIRQLVDERPGPAGTDAGIAGLLFQGVQELPAGLLAAPAGRGADPAMLVHPGMLLALVAQLLQIATQASSSGSVTSASWPARRLVTRRWRYRQRRSSGTAGCT